MIASSPTSAALLRSAGASNCSPSSGFSSRPHYYDHSSSSSHISNFPAAPASPRASRAGRGVSDSSGSSGVEEIQSALRRQTVDASTQYSRPSTPTRAQQQHRPAGPGQTDLPDANADAGAQGSDDRTRNQPGSHMARPSIGSKRTTPDAATVLSTAASGDPHTEDGAKSPTGSLSKRQRQAKPAPKLLPLNYEDANTRDLVVLISSMLMELIRFNDQIPLRDGRLTRFHSRSPPRISVPDYLQRLTTHATLSPPILLSMVYYIDRLCALYPAFTISSLTVHRFLISSATVASKGLSDSFWTNKTYARVGGISVAELALLELELLWRLEWRIVPQPEVLVDYYRSLVERCEEYAIQRTDSKAEGLTSGNGKEAVGATTA